MKEDQCYKEDHKLAKFIIMSLVIVLLVLNRSLDLMSLDIIAVIIWFMGTNPTAKIIEKVRKHSSQHDWL